MIKKFHSCFCRKENSLFSSHVCSVFPVFCLVSSLSSAFLCILVLVAGGGICVVVVAFVLGFFFSVLFSKSIFFLALVLQ